MKNLLKHDSIVQQVLIILLVLIIFLSVSTDFEYNPMLFCFIFIAIALYQYTVNIIKFCRKDFENTIARKVYIWLSTYVVITFFLAIVSSKVHFFRFLLDGAPVTWIILSPILIILSLIISLGDSKAFIMNK